MSSPEEHEQPYQNGGLLTGVLARGEQRHHSLVPREERTARRQALSIVNWQCDQHGCGGADCMHRNHRRDAAYLRHCIDMTDLLGEEPDESADALDLRLE